MNWKFGLFASYRLGGPGPEEISVDAPRALNTSGKTSIAMSQRTPSHARRSTQLADHRLLQFRVAVVEVSVSGQPSKYGSWPVVAGLNQTTKHGCTDKTGRASQ